ncbi:hypothetical protein E3E36_06265 [Thermococcus sp. M36]|uniref:hypothetical protein n=1 Tax=Thermococcus sp. M36 TaxID=1638261 RepID=UPI00143AB731|nr:hypothetical protein [Thermococcus sp. M36]NJE05752.1 hypothetical protein [Thermococcus sp. M36]
MVDVLQIGGLSLVGYEVARFLFEKVLERFGDRVVDVVGESMTSFLQSSSIVGRVMQPAFYRVYYSALRSGRFEWAFMRGVPHREAYLRIIRDSFLDTSIPAVANVAHTNNMYFWPKWAFSSMLLFTSLEIASPGAGEWTLKVEVPPQGIGIYNNRGRQFIKDYFLHRNPEGYREIREFYKTFMDMVASKEKPRNLRLGLRNRPLRWVAGGVIPLLWLRGKWWVAFPYRDIPPIGLNHFGGLSQDSEERMHPRLMALREFLEEFLILTEPPEPGAKATRKIIRVSGEFHEDIKVNRHFKRLQSYHKALREAQDGITIVDDKRDVVKMHSIDTPL